MVVDVGCGGSAMGFEVLNEGFGELVLTDISQEIVEVMRSRFAGDARVRAEVADCRQGSPQPGSDWSTRVNPNTIVYRYWSCTQRNPALIGPDKG